MRVNVNLAVEEGVDAQLAAVEIVYAEIDQCWRRAADDEVKAADLSARARRRGLGRVRLKQAELRRAGQQLGTRTALVSRRVREVLAEAGDAGEWPEVPDGVASLPGRRVGVVVDSGFRYPKRINIGLDPALAETVRRAAYWLSEPAETALQAWADRHGPGPAAGGLALLAAALRGFPSAEEMQARSDARSKIVTTGMIMRRAVWRAIEKDPVKEGLQQKLQDNAEEEGRRAGKLIASELVVEALAEARRTASS